MHGAGVAFFTVCFPAMFSIVDPFAAVPVYLALVGREERSVKRKTAIRATVTATSVLCLFSAMGGSIFEFFGVTLPAFKIAGGILLFMMALEMMRAKTSAVKNTPEETLEAKDKDKDDVAVIPLGIPILSGPGAIATAMLWSSRAKHLDEKVALYVAIGAVSIIVLVTLLSAASVVRFFGKTGLNIITRIMGLILAASAAQFVIDGARDAFSISG
jgi:multiple antibiotic resistance protein